MIRLEVRDLKPYPQSGQRVLATFTEADPPRQLMVHLVERRPDGSVVLELADDAHVPAEAGSPISLEFSVGGVLYRLVSQATGPVWEGRLAVAAPVAIETIQRRQFHRFPVVLSGRFKKVAIPAAYELDLHTRNEAVHDWLGDDATFAGVTTTDLGAGGVTLATGALVNQDEVYLEIAHPELSVSVAARVVRTDADGSTGHPRASLQFVGIEEEEQDEILQFILRREVLADEGRTP